MELILSPIKFLYLLAYTVCCNVTKSYALALPLLSVMTVTIIYFCHHRAAKLENDEKLIRSILEPQIAEIKDKYRGAERQAAIERLYHRYAYSPLYAVREAAGVLLQLPFLFGAYAMISTFPHLSGVSFGPIGDLSQPDRLLGGFNLLPFMMTSANIATVFLASPAGSRERKQGVISALIFLALLYGAPSALLVYWTGNNLLYLTQEVWKQSSFVAVVRKNLGIDKAAAAIAKLCDRITASVHFKSALVISLEVIIFAPLITYFSNGCSIFGDSPYTAVALTKASLPLWFGVFAALFILFIGLGRIKRLGIPAANEYVSYFELLLVACSIGFLLEGSFLGYGLPLLDGRQGLFNSQPRLIFDSMIWIALFAAFIICGKGITKHLSTILTAVFAACLILLAVESARAETDTADKDAGAFGLARAANFDIYKAIKYNDKNNVIVLIYDSLDTLTVEKTIEEHPVYRDALENFVIYRNNFWAGGHTRFSIPQMLTGRLYDQTTYRDLLDKAALSEDSLAGSSAKAGRSTYIISIPAVCVSSEPIVKTPMSKAEIKLRTAHFFKFLPYCLKKRWEGRVNFGNQLGTGWQRDDREVFKFLQQRLSCRSDKPVTLLTHFEGIHVPYTWDEDGNHASKLPQTFKARLGQTAALLKWTREYLNELRAAGLYDCSTIIITADHGFGGGHPDDIFEPAIMEQSPLMIVKYAYAKHPLAVDNAPLSGRDLRKIAEISYNNDETLPARIGEFIGNLPAQREFYVPNGDMIYLARGTDRDKLSIEKLRKRSDKKGMS